MRLILTPGDGERIDVDDVLIGTADNPDMATYLRLMGRSAPVLWAATDSTLIYGHPIDDTLLGKIRQDQEREQAATERLEIDQGDAELIQEAFDTTHLTEQTAGGTQEEKTSLHAAAGIDISGEAPDGHEPDAITAEIPVLRSKQDVITTMRTRIGNRLTERRREAETRTQQQRKQNHGPQGN